MINLQKGQRFAVNQQHIRLGLGWKPNTVPGVDFDLDCTAFLLMGNGKIQNEDYMNFYNNKISPDGAVKHSSDNKSGNSGVGDAEYIDIDVSKLNPNIKEIVFVITIDKAVEKHQTFGQVRDSYIRIVDLDTNEELCKYELDEDFSVEKSVEFGRLYFKDGVFKFDAMGVGYNETLQYFVDKYCDGNNYDDNMNFIQNFVNHHVVE
jgi:tellurium resistance protein TerD